jgi:Tfp pilus assembly protein PilX
MKRVIRKVENEEGASLIIALIFVVATSLVLIALLDMTSTNLINTANLQNERGLEYAAEGAVNGAIQVVRSLNANQTTAMCTGSTAAFAPGTPLNSSNVVAFCGDVSAPNYQRTVVFDACPPASSFAACQSTSLLEAQVTFVDISCPTPSSCPSPGFNTAIDYWVVKRANG